MSTLRFVRSSSRFETACRAAAVSMTMAVMAQSYAATPAQDIHPTLKSPAMVKVMASIRQPAGEAASVSPDQEMVLAYGQLPPIKTVIYGAKGKPEIHWTLHPFDLARLAREAATRVAKETGQKVHPSKIGAVLLAESNLVARTGWSSNGKTPSQGIAQFEADTANRLGINPLDPVEAATGVARLLADAQSWAKRNPQIPQDVALSIFYNTSSKLRTKLAEDYANNPPEAVELPVPTKHHISNMSAGVQRMNLFLRLADQHSQQALASNHHAQEHMMKVDASSSRQTQILVGAVLAGKKELAIQSSAQLVKTLSENPMNGTSTPSPSTKALVAGLPVGNMELARRVSNQLAMEHQGHAVERPMTADGLRHAHLALFERTKAARRPYENVLDAAERSLRPDQSSLSSFLQQARQRLQSLWQQVQSLSGEMFSPGQRETDEAIRRRQRNTGLTMQEARLQLQNQVRREGDHQRA